jgi:hypothetical protein
MLAVSYLSASSGLLLRRGEKAKHSVSAIGLGMVIAVGENGSL